MTLIYFYFANYSNIFITLYIFIRRNVYSQNSVGKIFISIFSNIIFHVDFRFFFFFLLSLFKFNIDSFVAVYVILIRDKI